MSASQVLRHVRRHPQMAALRYEPTRVEPFVAAHRQRVRAAKPLQHDQRRIAFCRPVGLEDFCVHDQSVAVFPNRLREANRAGAAKEPIVTASVLASLTLRYFLY